MSLLIGAKYDRKRLSIIRNKDFKLKTQEIGLLICIWENRFADREIDYATCVEINQRDIRYSVF